MLKNNFKKSIAVGAMSLATLGSSLLCVPMFYAENNDNTHTQENNTTKVSDKGVITVTSNDQTKGKKLANAEFKVEKNGVQLRFTKSDGNAYSLSTNGSYSTVTSDYYGNVKLIGLSSGDYIFTYTGNVMGYVADNTSITVHIENDEITTGTFNFTKDEGNASVSLKSEDGVAIPNAQFVVLSKAGASLKFNLVNGVYVYSDGSGSETIKTNAGGIITVKNIPSGSYTLKQTSAPEVYNGAYILKDFSVSKGNTATLNLVNAKEYGDLYLSLRSNSNTILNNSNFEIVKSDGTKMVFAKTHEGYKYDTTGNITSVPLTKNGDILVTGLPRGEYNLIQVKTASGYDPISNTSFAVNKNNKTTLNITNNRSVGGLKISIIDKDKKQGIKDFEYTIKNKDSDSLLTFTLKDGTYQYDASGNVTNLQTNENGVINVSGIPTNTIIVEQVKNNPDYMSDKDKKEINIKSKETSELNISTSEAKAIISVKNTKNDPVKDVKFIVTNEDGKEVINTLTNENGKIDMSSLEKGKYTYEMLEVPSGYSRSTKKVAFNILEKGKVDQLDEIILENAKIVVQLEKIEEKSCEGAEFTLTDNKTKKIIQTVKTNDKGIAEFKELQFGDYSIAQKSVPDGYKLVEDKINVTIDSKYSNEDKIIFNKNGALLEGEEKNNFSWIMWTVIGVLSLVALGSAGGYYYIKKRKNSVTMTSVDSDNDINETIPSVNDEE